MTVGRLLHELEEYGDLGFGAGDELTCWRAYERVEGFSYAMGNFHAGVIASTVANVAPRGRGARRMNPSDFYPARPQAARPRRRKAEH